MRMLPRKIEKMDNQVKQSVLASLVIACVATLSTTVAALHLSGQLGRIYALFLMVIGWGILLVAKQVGIVTLDQILPAITWSLCTLVTVGVFAVYKEVR